MAEISSVIQHASLTGNNIHVPYAGTYATEAARLAAALDQSMEGKLFRQLSDNTLWMLVSAANKTWIPLGKATAKYLGKDGNDDSPMTFYWSGQGGQPSWLWGGNDGVNMYVYNPANFSVNYANYANSANSANYANSAGSVSGLGGARVSGVVSRCGDEICVHAPAGGQYLILYEQRVAVTNRPTLGKLYVTLSPGIYAGGSHLGQTGNGENDDAYMVAYAGELYRV